MIKEFIRDCPGAMGTSIGEDCMLLLENFDEGAIMRAKMQKQSWEKDLLRCYCGSDGSGRNPNTLMRCSKCKIVAYCGQEHQKADWSKHKRRCFKPSWE
ncbi:hypothetical protein C8J56DRAFT_788298 [Mycena floridula]|nr:hypothetical protein C8J56DRAFT_788298 [Mycena floridula]